MKKNLFNIRVSTDELEIANTRVDSDGLKDLLKTIRRKYE